MMTSTTIVNAASTSIAPFLFFSLGMGLSWKCRQGHFAKSFMTFIATGPNITMKIDGKMNSPSGNNIFTGSVAAFFSAACRRSRRSVSE
jgi:hypothetical protein